MTCIGRALVGRVSWCCRLVLTGWRYVVEEMCTAGVQPHLAEPADTSAMRGPKRQAKTDKADAQLLRELLAAGRVPECYIPPSQVLEWRAALELYPRSAPILPPGGPVHRPRRHRALH
jgi:hypothetical protein